MKIALELVGAGGEPVDLWRTLASHGIASLPPAHVDDDARTLETTFTVGARARTVRLSASGLGHAALEVLGRRPSARDRETLVATVRHMLRLDENLSGFYALVARDPELAWATRGAGRMLRSPTVFEDVIKTVCTTNCTWSATVRMVTGLVDELGLAGPHGRAFPTPAAMADAPDELYAERVRAGYRGPYLRAIAAQVAEGLDLEELDGRSDLGDDEVASRLLALPGVGPYAAAHVMMLLGRYGRLILDSWTRPTYARLDGRRRPGADRTIERRFRRYGDYAGLAFWLYLTRDWVDE